MKRKLLVLVALSACALPLAAPLGAEARTPAPTVTKVSPLIVSIGRNLYVRGRNFTRGANRNTVIFERADGRSLFVRAASATSNRLTVRVPTSLRRLLATDPQGTEQPTRFRLRIVSRGSRRAGRPTRPALSPQVTLPVGTPPRGEAEADCDSDGTRNSADPDDDNDLLTDSAEISAGLDSCIVDTDRDGLEDGWEYWSAKDLNARAVPYPGRKPWPNPLDPSDIGVDFDGDVLTAAEEHAAWKHAGRGYDESLAGPGPQSPLSYSDGTQTSRPAEAPAVPAFRSGDYGIPFAPPAAYPGALELNGDGIWSDFERDVDADGLGNWVETHGPMLQSWWAKKLEEEGVAAWPDSQHGVFGQRPFADPSFTDPDSDGDTLLDAEDDQDADDVTNLDESWARWRGGRQDPMNPFNPCGPSESSRTCPAFRPL